MTGFHFLVPNTNNLIYNKKLQDPKQNSKYRCWNGHATEVFHVKVLSFSTLVAKLFMYAQWQTFRKEVTGFQGSGQLTKIPCLDGGHWLREEIWRRRAAGESAGEPADWLPTCPSTASWLAGHISFNRLKDRCHFLSQLSKTVARLGGHWMPRRCVPTVFYVTPHQRDSLWN